MEYVVHISGGSCQSHFSHRKEIADVAERLALIVFPVEQPLIWGGMPIRNIPKGMQRIALLY